MSYKKLIGGCMLFCMLGLTVFAEYDSSPKTSGDSNSGYEAVEFYDFDLEINYDADTRKAHVSWDDFPAGKDFKWYKLLYSTSNSNLVYPDQSAIFVGTQRANQLNHYFYLKDTETHYVRICAITEDPDEWNKGRYCSEVQKIVLDDFDDEDKPTMCTMEYAPVCGKKSNGEYHTFSNKCMMNAEGAKYMYS